MPDADPISSETLEILKTIPTQTLIDGLWVMGWPMSFIHGAKPLQPGQHMAGRAVTLRFVPHRPDLVADKPKGADSAEYVAIELVGPEEILVIDAMGWEYSSIGGDIKFLRMMQLKAGGLVTDGAARDSNTLKSYGFPVYAANTTAKQGPAEFWPWQVNDAIQCGGVLVRPGDVVVGGPTPLSVAVSREWCCCGAELVRVRSSAQEGAMSSDHNPSPPLCRLCSAP